MRNPRLDALQGRAISALGDALGYYRALATASLTPAELAEKTSTNERYARQWLARQAAGGHVNYEPQTGRYRAEIQRNVSECPVRLNQALRTLRAIRQRYEIDRARNPGARSLTLEVGLGDADICWISAVIELLEKSTAGSATHAGEPTGR